ncbi:S8 family serine peptidase, partial [Brachybacterium hainanense]
MTPHPFRRAGALTGALLLAAVGLVGPAALADPGDDDPGTSADAPAEPGAQPASPRVPVIVMMKHQPDAPGSDEEKRNLAAQDQLLSSWTQTYGIELDSQFGYLVNGFSATMPADQITLLSTQPEVASVRRERIYEPAEHSARQLEGVPTAFAEHGADGTGTVVAIIDSGIDPSHQDMRLDDCADAKIQEIDPSPESEFSCKVPTGYNYADENMVVKDLTSSQHGMHVAGIVAANGSEGEDPSDVVETGRVDGVAPNAQLLAMKVFSNTGDPGARDSDIIAAIEDSVKLDADVINMSLGSPNGFKNASDGTARAIEAARDAGVITVVSAGNDGQNFSLTGEDDDYLGLLDDGTVGAPGTQGSAFTIASIDNSVQTSFVTKVTGPDGVQDVPYEAATGTFDDAEHPLVDVGLGRVEDYSAGQDLGGAWALIERGEIAFTEKYQNAIDHGAGGVVVFNSAEGGDVVFGMAGVEEFSLPGIVMTHSDGLAVRASVAAGPSTIRVTEEVVVSQLDTALQPSSFTSWGTTSNLDFEPDVAGIGGSVYSTLNDDRYGTKSGTSMAAPNVAGMSALMVEKQREADAGLDGPERVDAVQVSLMNTAQVPVDASGVPASPRQVGAGLARVDRALDTEVLATVDGKASVALREISGERSFTVTLSNTGDEDRDYTVPAGQKVLAETNAAGEPTAVRVTSGTLSADASTVHVPAHGSAEVTFTLTPEGGADHFLGGWASLTAATPDEPDLAIPYLGFHGDWNAEQIVTPDGEELVEGLGVSTQLVGSADGATYPLQQEGFRLALSPNEDGALDAISPQLALQRNAADLRYEIVRADGSRVKTLGMEQNAYRTTLGDYLAAADPQAETWTGATFDGTVWDAQAADFAVLPDGDYVYRVSARLAEDYAWQSTDLPFRIDATAPTVSIGALEGTVLPVTVEETGSGLLGGVEAVAADGTALPVAEVSAGRYTVQVEDPGSIPYVTVSASDLGLNTGTATRVLSASPLVLEDEAALTAPGAVLGESSDLITDGVLSLRGFAAADVASVEVAGEEAALEDGSFAAEVELAEGANSIVLVARSAEGTELARTTLSLTYDATAPRITLADGIVGAQGTVALDDSGSVTLSGTVADERPGAPLSLRADGEEVPLDAEGVFSTTITPSAEQSVIVLEASDGATGGTLTLPIEGRQATGSTDPGVQLTNVDCLDAARACFIAGDSPDLDAEGTGFTLRGTADPSVTSIVLSPARTTAEEGGWAERKEIAADIAADGTFAVTFPVATGQTHVRLVATAEDGTTVLDTGLAFYSDAVAPTLQVDEPVLRGGTLFTAHEDVRFAGTAEDDGWGYAFALNESVVAEVYEGTGLGPDSNRRSFETELRVADGDMLLVRLDDMNGNTLLGVIPVVLDAIAPELGIEGLAAQETVPAERAVTARASDENLAALRVSVDGEVVSEQDTELALEEVSVEDVLFDTRDLGGDAAEEPAGAGSDTSSDAARAPAAQSSDGGGEQAAQPSDGGGEQPATAEEAEEAPAEPVTAAEAAAAEGTALSAAQTELEARVDLSDLPAGAHSLTVESTDLAGNVTARTVPFAIAEDTLAITGPDQAVLEVHREVLGDQASLGRQLLASYAVTADGEPADGAQLALAPGTVLVEGENAVTLVATAPGQQRVERTAAVTVALKQVTLRDGEVSATSTFRSDDALTASSSAGEDGATWTLSNRPEFAVLEAQIVLPAPEGSAVVRVLEDGTRVSLAATWADGALTFSGPSRGTYLVLAPADDGDGGPGDPGEGPGDGPGGRPGTGAPGTGGD